MENANRKYTYTGKIKISRSDMVWLRQGRKKCTIRMGIASVATPTILMSDGRVGVEVRITNVDSNRCLKDLSDQDARDEGFGTLAELISDLKSFYPRAKGDDRVTVIYFEPLEPQSSGSLFPE